MPRIRATSPALAIAVFSSAMTTTAGADESWRNDWFLSAPPSLARDVSDGSHEIALGANGDVLIGGVSYTYSNYQLARIGTDGIARWVANTGSAGISPYGLDVLAAMDDGGALLGSGDFVARIDASGDFRWSRAIPASAFAGVPGNRVVVAGCRLLTMLDDASGDVVWQQPVTGCPASQALSVDDGGNIYTLSIDGDSFDLVKHDTAGNVVWTVPMTSVSQGAAIAGVSGNLLLFVDTSAGILYGLRTIDASTAWQVNISSSNAVQFADAEPIVLGPEAISRLSADTGETRWTATISNTGLGTQIGDDLVVATSTHAIANIDLATGAIGWTASLPAHDALGNGLQYGHFGGLEAGVFSAVGLPNFGVTAPPLIQHVTLADGTLAGTVEVPSTAQGPVSVTILDGTANVIGAQSAWTASLPVVRIRRLANADGEMTWQQSQPLDFSLDFFGTQPYWVGTEAGIAGNAVAVAAAARTPAGFQDLGYGSLWLGLYDRASGNPHWQTFLHDADQGEMNSSAPDADSNGDVFVDASAVVGCAQPQGQRCVRQTLFKLSKSDGHVLWRFDDDFAAGDLPYANNFVMAGDDAIVIGPFDGGFSPTSLKSVAGANGTLKWMSSLFGSGNIGAVFPVDDGILAIGNGQGWAKLDRATGVPLWTGPPFMSSCTTLCDPLNEAVALPNGDVITAGEADLKPLVSLLRGDGSGEYQTWQLDPNDDAMHALIVNVRRDSSGGIWLGLLRGFIGATGGVSVLAKFDPATGTLVSQQVLRDRGGDALEPITLAGWVGSPESNRLLISSINTSAPLPTVFGSAGVDTSITAHGDLAASLTVDRSHVHAGEMLGFHARLTYNSDVAIDGAHLNVYLPWSSGARSIACAPTNATGCTMDARGGQLRATVDLMPGAVVDLTGQVLVLEPGFNETAILSAVAFGPAGLDEPDTVDNLARQVVVQALFGDGFDGD